MHLLIVILLAAALVVWLWRSAARGARPTTDNETALLQACLGSRQQAESLIREEQRRQPGLGRGVAVDRALAALRRDRR